MRFFLEIKTRTFRRRKNVAPGERASYSKRADRLREEIPSGQQNVHVQSLSARDARPSCAHPAAVPGDVARSIPAAGGNRSRLGACSCSDGALHPQKQIRHPERDRQCELATVSYLQFFRIGIPRLRSE